MTIFHGLRRAVALHSARPAILAADRTQSYGDFFQRVLRCAQALRGQGILHGDRVAVLMLNSPRFLELYFATAALGAVIVPINTRWNAADVDFCLRDSGTKLLLTDVAFDAVTCPAVPVHLHEAAYEPMIEAAAPLDPSAGALEEEDLAALMYTSGTTGGPKGVMLTHRNLYTHALQVIAELEIRPSWVYLHAAPMFHAANCALMYALAFKGAANVFLPAFRPETWLESVQHHRVTCAVLVPTMWHLIVNHPRAAEFDTSSLAHALYGGSPMMPDLLRRVTERFGPIFIQVDGMTEACPVITLQHAAEHRPERAGTAGRPMMGTDVRVVDDHDQDVPIGTPGEILMRGSHRMKGYWNRPEANAEVLRGGWLHTGDLGRLDDEGYLYVLDRKKDMVKTGGENVYCPEVEAVLTAHPQVLEAVIFGIPDAKWGESLRAAVVLRPGASTADDELIAFCRQRLTHFKCPSSVEFHESLPKGGSGKVQKSELRRAHWPTTPA